MAKFARSVPYLIWVTDEVEAETEEDAFEMDVPEPYEGVGSIIAVPHGCGVDLVTEVLITDRIDIDVRKVED